MILGESLKIIQSSHWQILSLWPSCLRLWARDLYWTHALFKGRLKICGVPSKAQGKDIKMSPKGAFALYSHSSSHCITKTIKLRLKPEKSWRNIKAAFNKMNIQPRMSLAEKSAFSVLIAPRYKGLIWIVLIERFDECNHDNPVSRTLGL